jgi:DNA-3-methyladenine glycosylase
MDPNFYLQSSVLLAPQLLGKIFRFASPEGIVSGKIVEVEAYHQNDPASHTFRGESDRNRSMFQTGGRLYVYTIYGLHSCVNIVAGRAGSGEGVLIRAVEPVEGVDVMVKNRSAGRDPARVSPLPNLTNGPAKLTQAFGITREHDGSVLGESAFSLLPGKEIPADSIVQTTRIGITKAAHELFRFYIKGNPFVSRK